MKISNRAEIMPSSPIRKLSGIAQKIEAEGIKIKTTDDGKKYLYIGITGLTNTKTGRNDIGAIKYDIY